MEPISVERFNEIAQHVVKADEWTWQYYLDKPKALAPFLGKSARTIRRYMDGSAKIDVTISLAMLALEKGLHITKEPKAKAKKKAVPRRAKA